MSLVTNFTRLPEDDMDHLLRQQGWEFSGIGLFKHSNDLKQTHRTKAEAVRMLMNQIINDNERASAACCNSGCGEDCVANNKWRMDHIEICKEYLNAS